MPAVAIEAVVLGQDIRRHSKTTQCPAASTVHFNANSLRRRIRLALNSFSAGDVAEIQVNITGSTGLQIPAPVVICTFQIQNQILDFYDDGDLVTGEFNVQVVGANDAFLTEVILA
jgi:hypothetical protein